VTWAKVEGWNSKGTADVSSGIRRLKYTMAGYQFNPGNPQGRRVNHATDGQFSDKHTLTGTGKESR
jgi:hypothetical protein